MKIELECISCIFNQALRVTKELKLDTKVAKEILDRSALMLPKFDLNKTPPQNATPIYQEISKILKVDDLYSELKQNSIKEAKKFIPLSKEYIKNSNNKFKTATKIAVAGNVIDLASEIRFDLKDEMQKVLTTPFAIDHTDILYDKLKSSKIVVYLADNAGENIFDQIYLESIKEIFKDIKIYYFVRSEPIINDICIKDIKKDDPLYHVASIVDSGVKTPGLIIDDMKKEAKELFKRADCIISKGMGNFECLNEVKNYPIFYLLKIKCLVVARELNLKLGDIVCKSHNHV